MNNKFQNKYRIPSARAPWWDYGNNAAYFVTICTRNREHYFGEIIQHTMRLTEIGKQAEICWNEIPEHFPFVIMDEFVVMPNHVHGILVFNKNGDDKSNCRDAKFCVSTIHPIHRIHPTNPNRTTRSNRPG